MFYERHEDPDDYIQDYERIREVLIDDFGPPALDEIRWLDEETDQVDPSGKAVCEGMVTYRSEWIAQNTIVTLHLEGADQKCRKGVVFDSKEHFLIERKKKQPVQPEMKEE